MAHCCAYDLVSAPLGTDLWKSVHHLMDVEYTRARLQTLQIVLLNIYGRPVANPGGNHIEIGRVSRLLRLELTRGDRPGPAAGTSSGLYQLEFASMGALGS